MQEHQSRMLSKLQTFFRNVISEEGGNPGFDALAVEITMPSDSSEARAWCRAFNVSFTADETCNNYHRRSGNMLITGHTD